MACAPEHPPPQPVPQHHSSGAQLVPIEQVPPLEMELYEHAARDCRLSTVVRRRFAAMAVHPCGTIQLDEGRGTDPAARARELRGVDDCIAAAVAAGTPFISEQHLRGTDSDVADALVGVREHGELVLYELGYDGDPCGGTCSEKGHTTVQRCSGLVRMTRDSCHQLCFECTSPKDVEDCEVGRRP